MENELKELIGTNETILYEGKPEKKCFILESMNLIMIPFLLFHMMPVWIYLGGMIFTFRRFRNTYYIVSDHAVYVSGGTFTKNMQ